MTAKPFFDTNILVYAFAQSEVKTHAVRDLVSRGGVFSVQVANEFVDVTRRKFGWSWEEVAVALTSVRHFLGSPISLTDEIHRQALEISTRHGFRIYDSLLISAARSAGCATLYSEDMQHEQVLDGVTIYNPFKSM